MECIICKEYKELFHNLNGCVHRVCTDCKECMLSSSLCYTVSIGERCLKCPECREIEKIPYEVLLTKAKYMERDFYTLANMLKTKEIENYRLLKKQKKCEEEKEEMLNLIKVIRSKRTGKCSRECVSEKTHSIKRTSRICSNELCDKWCCKKCKVCKFHSES